MKSWITLSTALLLCALTTAVSAQDGGSPAPGPSDDAFTRLASSFEKAMAKHDSAMVRLSGELTDSASEQAKALAQAALDQELAAFVSGLEAIQKKLDILDPPPPAPPVKPDDGALKEPAPEPTVAERARHMTDRLKARIKKMKAERGNKGGGDKGQGDGGRGGRGNGNGGDGSAPGKSGDAGKENAPGQQKKTDDARSATGKGNR